MQYGIAKVVHKDLREDLYSTLNDMTLFFVPSTWRRYCPELLLLLDPDQEEYEACIKGIREPYQSKVAQAVAAP